MTCASGWHARGTVNELWGGPISQPFQPIVLPVLYSDLDISIELLTDGITNEAETYHMEEAHQLTPMREKCGVSPLVFHPASEGISTESSHADRAASTSGVHDLTTQFASTSISRRQAGKHRASITPGSTAR